MSIIKLVVFALRVIILSVIMQSVIILSVIAPMEKESTVNRALGGNTYPG